MDGFWKGKRFFCKEWRTLKVWEDEAQSFFFDIGVKWNDLSEKEKRISSYVQKSSPPSLWRPKCNKGPSNRLFGEDRRWLLPQCEEVWRIYDRLQMRALRKGSFRPSKKYPRSMWRASIAQKQKLYLALWCGWIRVGKYCIQRLSSLRKSRSRSLWLLVSMTEGSEEPDKNSSFKNN